MSTSSPNQDDDSQIDGQSVSTSDLNGYCYVVRLTPMEKYSLEDLKKFLTEMDNHSWILAVESKPKLHYHCVIENDDGIDDFKKRIRSFLYTYWDVRPRGWGNAQYNCQVAQDKNRAISYALKDREVYYYEGYDQEYIDYCLRKSFTKKSPSTFKVEYRELCHKFQTTDMDNEEFMTQFVTLKSRYGQKVSPEDAYGYALSNSIQRDASFARKLVKDFLLRKKDGV